MTRVLFGFVLRQVVAWRRDTDTDVSAGPTL
jgi:hypothetical protein